MIIDKSILLCWREICCFWLGVVSIKKKKKEVIFEVIVLLSQNKVSKLLSGQLTIELIFMLL